MRPALLTVLALALAWPIWWAARWVQGAAGLEFLGLVFPAAALLLALGLAARWLDRH